MDLFGESIISGEKKGSKTLQICILSAFVVASVERDQRIQQAIRLRNVIYLH